MEKFSLQVSRAELDRKCFGVIIYCVFFFVAEQEIDSVCVEFKKYGVTMPAFQKIGGLLAGELDCDSASLHAAIISINEAIDEKVITIISGLLVCFLN